MSIASEIKQERDLIEKCVKGHENLAIREKKMKADKVREEEKKVGFAKYKVEQKKVRHVSRVYERQLETEENLREIELKRIRKLNEIETQMLQKLKNTQLSQEVALVKFRTVLDKKPTNYEQYREKIQEYRLRLKSIYQSPRNLTRSICATTHETMDPDNPNSLSNTAY